MKHCGCTSSGQGKGSFLRLSILPTFTDKLFQKPTTNNYNFKVRAIKCWFLYHRCSLEQFHFHLSHPCIIPGLICSVLKPSPPNPPQEKEKKKNCMWQHKHNKKRVLSHCNLNVDGIITALLPLQLAAAFFMFAYEAWTVALSLQRPSVEDFKIQPQQLKWQPQRCIGHMVTQKISSCFFPAEGREILRGNFDRLRNAAGYSGENMDFQERRRPMWNYV